MRPKVYRRRRRPNPATLQQQQAQYAATVQGIVLAETALALHFLGPIAQPGGVFFEKGRQILGKEVQNFLIVIARVMLG
jgi:hypothetical protein